MFIPIIMQIIMLLKKIMNEIKGNKAMQKSSKTSLKKENGKCNNIKEIMLKYNPDEQLPIVSSPQNAVLGQHPTLAHLKQINPNAAAAWLIPQISNLSEYCGARDKITDYQIKQLADIISHDYPWLKVSELMLFFHRFKAAKYGRFYGTVDPLIITEALRSFLLERAEIIDAYEQKEREKRDKESRAKAVTWEEYCAMKGIKNRPSPI